MKKKCRKLVLMSSRFDACVQESEIEKKSLRGGRVSSLSTYQKSKLNDSPPTASIHHRRIQDSNVKRNRPNLPIDLPLPADPDTHMLPSTPQHRTHPPEFLFDHRRASSFPFPLPSGPSTTASSTSRGAGWALGGGSAGGTAVCGNGGCRGRLSTWRLRG